MKNDIFDYKFTDGIKKLLLLHPNQISWLKMLGCISSLKSATIRLDYKKIKTSKFWCFLLEGSFFFY